MFTAPKTAGGSAGVGLSPRVVSALVRQAELQKIERALWGETYDDDGLVFARENGTPQRPEYVLRRFHELTEDAGYLGCGCTISGTWRPHWCSLPRCRWRWPPKMLRHSQVGITADLYGHLTREASHAAADGLGAVLDAAAAELAAERSMRNATTVRPNDHGFDVLEGADTSVSAGQAGAPDRIRTCNLLIRSQVLYPLSYGRSFSCAGPGAGCCAEAPGFEPGMGGDPKPH